MNEAGNPTTSSCRALKLAIGSVVHSENLPKVSFWRFFLPKPLHLMGKTGGQTAFAGYDSLIHAAQRWMLESQLDKEWHNLQIKASTVEFDPQTLSNTMWHALPLWEYHWFITSMIQSISIWFRHSLRSAKTETLFFTCFNQVSTYKTTSQHETPQDTRW